jgi:hypothetical protein
MIVAVPGFPAITGKSEENITAVGPLLVLALKGTELNSGDKSSEGHPGSRVSAQTSSDPGIRALGFVNAPSELGRVRGVLRQGNLPLA